MELWRKGRLSTRRQLWPGKHVRVAAVLIVTLLMADHVPAIADSGTEQRIAQFWQRVNAMQPGEYLSAVDIGQWAQNLIDRDPRARLTVGDFRALAETMQAGFDRAGPGVAVTPAPASPARTVTPTPPPTPTPTPSPAPTLRRNATIGDKIRFNDGWQLTLVKFEEQAASRYSTPKPGFRYVTVTVRFDNGSQGSVYASPLDFKLQDSTGVRRTRAFLATDRNDELSSGQVAPGSFVSGSVTFEAPVGDTRLQLIYDSYPYTQTTFDLY